MVVLKWSSALERRKQTGPVLIHGPYWIGHWAS
ncbi:uncharacterized protein G2W53_005957 [Senna tora]|uniref:Uncharacterized protein n=1 Tax=Senna tora TaxID=362788 RepID=A0A834X4C9_9FABA|nr:uncharacterized protein G2W53_005957 [Senna tora]